MNSRFIISTDRLDEKYWRVLYNGLSEIVSNNLKEETLKELLKFCSINQTSSSLNKDVFKEFGNSIYTKNQINYNHEQADVVVLYTKLDDSRDFYNIVPFIHLLEKFSSIVSLGINIEKLNDSERFYFSCSQFLQNYNDYKNKYGGNSIYFIKDYSITDKETGEIRRFKTKKIANIKELKTSISNQFSPLLTINKDAKYKLFDLPIEKNAVQNEEHPYNLIHFYLENKSIKRKAIREYISKKNFDNIFSKYFILYVLNHFVDNGIIKKELEFDQLYIFLNTYTSIIKELVENIVLHTKEKKGYLYFAFNSAEDIIGIDYLKKFIESTKEDITRYFEFNIYDFNDEGILDTFECNSKKIALHDFYNLQTVLSDELTHLEYRHTAHLGLKSFTKSLVKNNGYFRVESNSSMSKKELHCSFNSNKEYNIIENDVKKYFIDGTHYNIILPFHADFLINSEQNYATIQLQSFKETYINWLSSLSTKNPISLLNTKEIINSNISKAQIDSKEKQIEFIKIIGEQILTEHDESNETIAIDFDELLFLKDRNLLLKVLSYVQLNSTKSIRKVIIFNVEYTFVMEFKQDIDAYFIKTNSKIWSNQHALILITKNLTPYIISGEKSYQLNQINNLVRMFYPKKKSDFIFAETDNVLNKKWENNFLQPFELLVGKNHLTLFESYVADILDNSIEDSKIGYKINSKYTRLGNKIITENYYEADTLFQNSFFVERFAYLVCSSLSKIDSHLPLILIGYGSYSEFLLKTISDFAKRSGIIKIETLVIGHDIENNDWTIQNYKSHYVDKPENYQYATIVPISSTLTTNDKLFSKFIKYISSRQKNQSNFKSNLIYNCSLILVRDYSSIPDTYNSLSDIEKQIGWHSNENKIIKTNYTYASKVEYFIEKEGKWLIPINNRVSFPENYIKEEPINNTNKTSLNSQRLFGWPLIINISKNQFQKELQLLELFKKDIYFGHFEKGTNHFQYYFDTETFSKRRLNPFSEWLTKIQESIFTKDCFHILVTPGRNMESDFITMINEIVFHNHAHIIFINSDDDYRSNIINKFSFLKEIEKEIQIKIHFADHALTTGKSISKTKSYLSSILNKNVSFSSIITILNRLSVNRYDEINEYNGNIIHSFINLFIPPIKNSESDCGICNAINHYQNNILPNTSLDTCYRTVSAKIDNMKIKALSETSPISYRGFNRMKIAHQIYFQISHLRYNSKDSQEIIENLRTFFTSINLIEDKITFVKAISSHPLNHYIHLRNFAHKILLIELDNVLKKEIYEVVYFNYLLILLKHLSILGSNSLIRKDVILSVWSYFISFSKHNKVQQSYTKTVDEITNLENKKDKELGDNERYEILIEKRKVYHDFLERFEPTKEGGAFTIPYYANLFHFFIKNITYNDENKSLWLGELLRRGKEIEDFNNITISDNIPNNELFKYFNSTYDESELKAYKSFLVGLFFDNTTIIRKTLENFISEINYKSNLYQEFFYQGSLKPFDELDYTSIREKLKNLISSEYYYSNASKYINSTSDCDLLTNLIDLTYLKLFLKTLEEPSDLLIIQSILDVVLSVLTKIMGADSAFLTISDLQNQIHCYTVSSYNLDHDLFHKIKFLGEGYYTKKTLNRNELPIYPMITQSNLKRYNENRVLGYANANILLINDLQYKNAISSITFLYKTNKEDLKLNSKEVTRLVLLVKNELFTLLKTSFNNNILNDWINKARNEHKFEKIYGNSDHYINSYVKEAFPEIEKILKEVKQSKTLSKTYYVFSNITISQIYSNIEKNNGQLKLNNNYTSSSNPIPIVEILNGTFKSVLKSLEQSVFKDCGSISFKISDSIKDETTTLNKYIIQTFIIQCLQNAMNKHLQHFDKKVVIELCPEYICISNNFGNSHIQNGLLAKSIDDFNSKVQSIRNLDCDEYSSTTLTSIQGYLNAMSKKCEFGYNTFPETVFYVKIYL